MARRRPPISGLPSRPGELGQVIAATALRYVGHPYAYGGAKPSGWDCSGFVNYVLGHDLGLTLPGGTKNFSGAYHGPVVAMYATWGKAPKVAHPAEGDLVIWPGIGPLGHIGFALGGDQMISALNPADGTAVTTIGATKPGPHIYRRIGAASSAPVPVAGGGCVQAALMLPVLIPLGLIRKSYGRGRELPPGAQENLSFPRGPQAA